SSSRRSGARPGTRRSWTTAATGDHYGLSVTATSATAPRKSPRGSPPASSPRGSRERDEVRNLPGRRRGRPHRLAPAMARRAGRRLHELRVEGRDGVRLSDAITQALTQGQRVRYASVVGNTVTGTQLSIAR